MFSLPTRHILTLGQDPLVSLFDAQGIPLVFFVALNKKPWASKGTGNFIFMIKLYIYMVGCDFSM